MSKNLVGIFVVLIVIIIIWKFGENLTNKEHFYWYYPPSANCMENVFGNLQCAKYPWWFYGSYYPYFPIRASNLTKYDFSGKPINFPSSKLNIKQIAPTYRLY